MFINRTLSVAPFFLKPSLRDAPRTAIFAAIEIAARLNWEVSPYISDLVN